MFESLKSWFNDDPELGHPTVLVVDDDDLLKPSMARVLYSLDPEIDLAWASDIAQAKAILNTKKVSLVIVDCFLGEMENGFELWNFCQKYFQDVPFVMISGMDDKSISQVAGKVGHLPPMVQKPVSMEETREVIKSYLG